jgi:hypothetical protein
VGTSVEPWIAACPRSAMMPPPGRPKFPSSSWSSAAHPMICTPYVCCVQATAYAKALVRSRPEFASSVSATWMNFSSGQPQIRETISGV